MTCLPPFCDSHVHLDDPAFDADREEVVARAREAGVGVLIVPGVARPGWARIAQLGDTCAIVRCAYGIHPLFVESHDPNDIEALSAWLDDHPAVAIGEIGLDFHDPTRDPEQQRRFFIDQLKLAHERDLPVIVHARKALEEIIQLLRKWPRLRGVVHSFSGSEQQAQQLFDLGFHLGIGGTVTYDRAQRLRRIVASMPIEHLLLESDAPDQPDAWHRGQRNEPARVIGIARCIATLRGQPEEALAEATTANVHRLFAI